LRGGSGPEAWQAAFDAWDGSAWTNLGAGVRIAGGWQLNGVSLSNNATVRARGHVIGGQYSGSTWFVEDGIGPLLISTQPRSSTNLALTTVTFFASAVGHAPKSYQWRKDGVPLNNAGPVSGAATPLLTLADVLGGDAGDYSVVISNSFGSVTSAVATLTVIDPVITTQPVSQSKQADESITFSVGVIGTQPFNYQWRHRGSALDGATSAALTLTNLQGSDAGHYDAVVSNAFGSATSTAAVLTVNLATVDTFNPVAGGGTPTPASFVNSLAAQADGRILVGGRFSSLGGQTRSNIGRLNSDGTLDVSFNPGAGHSGSFAPAASINCLAVQTDGEIVVGGSFTTLDGQSRTNLGRLNADGTLDVVFDPRPNGAVTCLAVQPDGKILVGGGFDTLGGQSRGRIGRLNADGTLDTGFNPDANGSVLSLAVQADRKIVVGGTFTTLGGETRNRLGRLEPDGSLDVGFNAGANGAVHAVAVQPDGKILIGGAFTSLAGHGRNRIARLNADGTLDLGFNPGANNAVHTIVAQANGKILIGGTFTNIAGLGRSRIARLNADGAADLTFDPGTGGSESTFLPSNPSVYSIAVQADGKILVGGDFTVLGGQSRSRIGRLNNTEPASQELVFEGDTATWLRGGSSPEVWHASLGIWDGTAWTVPEAGERIIGGWQWSLPPLPPAATVRVRAYATGGRYNGSAGVVQIGAGPLVITEHPADYIKNLGSTVTLSVAAVGSEPISYQWYKDAAPLPNHAATLTLSNLLRSDAGAYYVVLSNVFGSVTSAVATLTVRDPFITGQPSNQSRNAGQSVSFSVTAGGTAPLQYQWRKEGITLENATNATLTLTNLQGADAANYDVIVANAFNTVTSAVATLTVADPFITSHPASQSAALGSSLVLTASAAGTPPLIWQWHKDGLALDGATQATLTLTDLHRTDAGDYEAVVSNIFGTATSATATLTVNLATPDAFDPGAHGNFSASVNVLAIQADGKILVGGSFTNLGGHDRSCIGRLNAYGTVDTAFDPGATGAVHSIVVQADGKIVLGGIFVSLGGEARSRIGRLNADGSLDESFNQGANGSVSALALQPDGKILVGGSFTEMGGQSRSHIGRLNADGSLDESFNPGASSPVNSIAVQSDGKILVGGHFSILGGLSRINIGRLNADGSLDTNFNPGVTGLFSSSVNSLAIQSDGKIIVGGEFIALGGQLRTNLGRLNPDGTADGGFNPGAGDRVTCLAVQADGRIFVGGPFTTLGGLARNYIGRLNADGRVDSSFDPGAAGGVVRSIAVQPDGRILVGGAFNVLGGEGRNRIGRLNNTEPATKTLAANGHTALWLCGGSSPHAWRTAFDYTTDGIDWVNVGEGVPTLGGWQLTNVALPTGGILRARGHVTGGLGNGSSWFVETTTIIGAPAILSPPLNATNYVGTTALFSVVALGAEPLHYEWRKDGANLTNGGNLSGSDTDQLTLADVQLGDAGNYSVVVSNQYGSVTSVVATLTVLPAIPETVSPQWVDAEIKCASPSRARRGASLICKVLPTSFTGRFCARTRIRLARCW
jgi:uncharacterized delta-60 repeat protein